MKFKLFLILLVLFSSACERTELEPEEKAIESELTDVKATVRNISPRQFVNGMGPGWNMGNYFDAFVKDKKQWGNPEPTEAMIKAVKKRGFKTLRIPVTWAYHQGGAPNYTIEKPYLNRVDSVATWGIRNGMHVIINLHHEDKGEKAWLTPVGSASKISNVEKRLKKTWTQIANRFKRYGDKLIFETLNEPRAVGTPNEWNGGTSALHKTINRYNKACVDAIRATKGNNAKRFIMVPTYAASARDNAMKGLVIPNGDPKVIVSIHNYFPFEFSLGNTEKKWGTNADKKIMTDELKRISKFWNSKGRVVIMGEWASMNQNNLTAREDHAEHYANTCMKNGIIPVWWDNGLRNELGIFNRKDRNWYFGSIADKVAKAKR